jgi:hypothetical protein
MPTTTFFTRHRRVAFLRHLVERHSDLTFERNDLKRLFTAVDEYCSAHLPKAHRGGWFPLVIAGGVPINHIPPHMFFTTYAIYSHMARGDVEPVPFLAGPPSLDGATAVQMPTGTPFVVLDRDAKFYPMTDMLLLIPASTRKPWTQDFYGLPPLAKETLVVSWHSAAQPHLAAVASGQLLVRRDLRKVLNPLGLFTMEDEREFFSEPAPFSKLERYRLRMEELLDVPQEVLLQNTDQARQVLEAYFSRYEGLCFP